MPANPLKLTLASDTSCPAATATVVLDSGASPLIKAGAGGGWFLTVETVLALVLGATPPTALTIALSLVTAGANQDTYALPVGLLTANAVILATCTLLVPNSGTFWYPTGDEVQITVNPTGQAVTCKAVGTRGLLSLPQGV
jgi:hypothetical protein